MAQQINEQFETNNAFPTMREGAVAVPGARGMSAYEIAVAHGFDGSEADWLASLNGADGQDGADAPAVTTQEIMAEVQAFMAENPAPAGRDGTDGINGTNGRDAPPPTDAQIATQVANYLAANPPAAGKDGAKGADGKDGTNGSNGTNGKDAPPVTDEQIYARVQQYLATYPVRNGVDGTNGTNGTNGKDGAKGLDATQIQSIRAQTTTAGVYTWVFAKPYPAGVTPVVGLTVEDNSAGDPSWNHKITAISNTGVTVKLAKTTAVTLLGISVLGLATAPQAFVHLTATAPA